MATPEEIARLYMSPRAIELDLLDRYVKCSQYEGRLVEWFDVSSDKPIFERRPCINYPIAKSAIGSHVSFVLGEGRWPALTSSTSEDDTTLDDQWGLTKEDSDLIDRFVNVILCRYARLKKVAREMLGDAMGCKSVAVVIAVKGGRICAETVRAAWATPTLNDLGECIKLEIQYPYIESFYNDDSRRWDKRCMLYRRVIDEVTDTVYVPAKALDSGRQPVWVADKTKSRSHGLGFCPVLWYAFMKPASTANEVDGVALHQHQLSEIDCLNYALSQKQRAATVTSDPQMFETGVAEDVNPAPIGQTAHTGIEVQGVGADGKPMGVFSSGPSQRARRRLARKRGAGIIWRYPDKDSRVGYLTIPGDSLKTVDEHAKDLRTKIAESLRCIFISPSEIKTHTTLSGKALAFLFAAQLAYDDTVRDDFIDGGLLPLVNLLLRVVLVVGRDNPKKLYVPGVEKIVPILEKFEVDIEGSDGGARMWMPPRMEPVWGPYFAPNEHDQLAVVQLVCLAVTQGTITRQMAVEKLAQSGVFEVGSAKEVVEQILKEKEEERDAANAALHKATDALAKTGSPGAGSSPRKGMTNPGSMTPGQTDEGPAEEQAAA
jgi:hypothetical protein